MWYSERMKNISATRMIYALTDPLDQKVKYIGYTKNFFTRIQYHFHDKPNTKGDRCATYPWLKELAEHGVLPHSFCVEILTDNSDWQERERYWIKFYREQGEPLLNLTAGGHDGGWGWHRMTPERRAARIEKIKKNMPELAAEFWKDKSPEQRTEIMRKRGLRTKELHPNHFKEIGEKGMLAIAKLRENGTLGPLKQETKSKISNALRNHWDSMTPEQRKNRLEIWHAKRIKKSA